MTIRKTASKTAKFVVLPLERKLAFIEAGLLLVTAWSVTSLLPYAWWTRLLGPAAGEQQAIKLQPATQAGEMVNWAVHTAARQIPWNVVCLPQAIAGRWMLARRNVECALCIGVRSAGTLSAQGPDMHAWLALEGWMSDAGGIGNDWRVIARFGAHSDAA